MIGSEKSIKVTVSVEIDKAKQALNNFASASSAVAEDLKKVSSATDQLGKSAKTAGDQIKTGADEARSSGVAHESMSMGVFKGTLAYKALEFAVKSTIGILKDSVMGSLDAQRAMQQVETNVKNAGLAFDKIGPKLNEYSRQMIQLGFDDEATATSVSKLILVTNDYDKAIKLNQLSMDLARSKNIDLATATELVTQVTQGNGRVLKQYGIELDDTASAADNLAKLHVKVADSANAFSDTVPGKVERMNVKWDNVKETIGDQLMPTINILIDTLEKNLPVIQQQLSQIVATINAAVIIFDKVGGIGNRIFTKMADTLFGEVNPGLQMTEEVMSKMPDTMSTLNESMSPLPKMMSTINDQVVESNNELAKSIVTYDGIGVAADSAAKKQTDAADKAKEELKKQTDAAQKGLDGLINSYADLIRKQDEFSFKSETDLSRFGDLIRDTAADQDEWLKRSAQGFDALSSHIDGITGDIQSLNGEMKNLTESFDDFLKSTAESSSQNFAQIIFDAEKAVPELEKKLQDAERNMQSAISAGGNLEGPQKELDEIRKQLDEKRSILQSYEQDHFQDNQRITQELAFMREQDSRNALDQAFEVMQRSIQMKTEEFEAEKKQLQEKIDLKEQERDMYLQAQADMTLAFKENVELRQESVKKEIENLKLLTDQINKTATAYKNLPKTVGGVTGARAEGGPVTGGQSYLVGEKGPELFTPAQSGVVIPNSQMSGGVTINVNNPVVRSEGDIRDIVSQVSSAMSRRDELAQFGALK